MRTHLYIYEQLRIGFKSLKEYKMNMYSGLMAHIAHTSATFLIVYSFAEFVLSINLTVSQILFYTIYLQMFFMFCGILRNHMFLNQWILTGKLNSFLTKPINPYIQYLFTAITMECLVLAVFDFFILIGIYFYFDLNIDLIKLFIGIILSFIGVLFMWSLYRFIDVLAFFIKDNKFIYANHGRFEGIISKFPLIFTYPNLSGIIYFFGCFMYGILPSLYFFDIGVVSLKFLIHLSISQFLLSIIFLFGIIIGYQIGIKKYEAFS